MKKLIPVFFISIISLFCSSYHEIAHEIVPADSIETEILEDKCGLAVNKNFEINLTEIKEEDLKEFINNDFFYLKKRNKGYRLPELTYFRVIVKNSGETPIETGLVKLYYNDVVLHTLDAEYLFKNFKSPVYPSLDYIKLFRLFTYNMDDPCGNSMEYGTDITEYSGKSIKPGDSVMLITAFSHLPVNIRKFNLSIEIKSDIIQKVIDFKLMRFEYRKSGKYFIKPEKNKDE